MGMTDSRSFMIVSQPMYLTSREHKSRNINQLALITQLRHNHD